MRVSKWWQTFVLNFEVNVSCMISCGESQPAVAPLAHLPLSQRFGWLSWTFRPCLLRALRDCHYRCSVMLLIDVLLKKLNNHCMYTAPGCVLLFNISLHINGQQQLCRVKKRLEALKKNICMTLPQKAQGWWRPCVTPPPYLSAIPLLFNLG